MLGFENPFRRLAYLWVHDFAVLHLKLFNDDPGITIAPFSHL